MAYKRDVIKKIVQTLAKDLNSKGIPVERIYLFGSYARGKPKRRSDIDIAVVSPKFKAISDLGRIKLLSDVARYIYPDCEVDIDVVGFTRDEIDNASYFDLAGEISQNGKIVYDKAA